MLGEHGGTAVEWSGKVASNLIELNVVGLNIKIEICRYGKTGNGGDGNDGGRWQY